MSAANTYSSLFAVIKKRFRLFAVVGVLAIIISAVFSSPFFIAPKFKSTAVLYPSNLITYSTESSTEQLLQLLHGNDIRDSIIDRFDLVNHYDFDTASSGYLTKLYREFEGNMTIKKTNFESVIIEVMDTDPKKAKAIADAFIYFVNQKVSNMHKGKAKERVQIWNDQLGIKKTQIDTLEAQIKAYSVKYGLLDYTQQSREVTAGYMNMLLGNRKGESMKKAEELYDNVKKEGRHYHDLHHQLNLAREDYNKILINYEDAVKDVNKELTYTNTVVYPEEADKKAYPVRWVIVLLSLMGSLLFTFVLVLFQEQSNPA